MTIQADWNVGQEDFPSFWSTASTQESTKDEKSFDEQKNKYADKNRAIADDIIGTTDNAQVILTIMTTEAIPHRMSVSMATDITVTQI